MPNSLMSQPFSSAGCCIAPRQARADDHAIAAHRHAQVVVRQAVGHVLVVGGGVVGRDAVLLGEAVGQGAGEIELERDPVGQAGAGQSGGDTLFGVHGASGRMEALGDKLCRSDAKCAADRRRLNTASAGCHRAVGQCTPASVVQLEFFAVLPIAGQSLARSNASSAVTLATHRVGERLTSTPPRRWSCRRR